MAQYSPQLRLLLLAASFSNVSLVHGLLSTEDWLVHRPLSDSVASFSELKQLADGARSFLFSNGLVSRRFAVKDGQWATVSLAALNSAASGGGFEQALRGLSPEARLNVSCPRSDSQLRGSGSSEDGEPSSSRRLLDYAAGALNANTDPHVTGSSPGSAGLAVGGLRGQQRYAMLESERWNLTKGVQEGDFVYMSHEAGPIQETDWEWTPGVRQSSTQAKWPPAGVRLRVRFAAPPGRCGCYCGLEVDVVYELYDGLPTFGKWVELRNAGSHEMLVETLVVEELHVGEQAKRRLHLETNFMPRKTDWAYAQAPASDPHGGSYNGALMNYPTWWIDPDYELDLNDQSLHGEVARVALLLQLQYPLGPWQPLLPGAGTWASFKAWLTVHDSDDVERQSLGRRQVLRTLFPQVTEAPLYFYATRADSASIRTVADQCAATGFEAILLSSGSGFDPSSTDPTYIAQMASDVAYVHSKGLIIGGYTLMQNPPGLSGNDFCATPDGQTGYNTHIADFTTKFHQRYRDNIVAFLGATKMDMLETDGPYEGATCGVTNSSGFSHENNSQVGQWNATVGFYRELKKKYGTYLTVPDPYWMSGGTNKEPMGYTDAWNHIPSDAAGTREYLTTGRMYLYDATYHKPTTMGWLGFEMYRTPSPMEQYVTTLELAAASYLGQGNVPIYRGPNVFDVAGGQVQNMWSLWTAHYKKYRSILMTDAVHVTRPGQNGFALECSLNVNATSQEAFANFFNPTSQTVAQLVKLPVYYAGLPRGATVHLVWGGSLVKPASWPVPTIAAATVEEDYSVRLNVSMAPYSFLWLSLTT